MNEIKFFSCLLGLVLLTMSGCNNVSSEKTSDDKLTKENRNMGGLDLPRGLIQTSENLLPGYILFNPPNSTFTYLMNRDGQVLKEWTSDYSSIVAYLTDSSTIVRHAQDPDFPRFQGGGMSGRIQELSWEGDLIWDFEYASEEHLTHHDIALLPNGNVLAIAWEAKNKEEAIAAGRKLEFTPEDGLWPDKILEFQPVHPRSAKVVWEWHAWDHLIQDHDPNLPNYGDPAQYPERLNINASAKKPEPMHPDTFKLRKQIGRLHRNITIGNRGSDVFHFNAINYNAELDQIAFSSPNLNEIFIIDHSTTTEEAKGHTGGKYDKGGDFLYRWGNPQNYSMGDSTDQQLFAQHDICWIPKGFPGEGHLTVFNNKLPGSPPDSLDYSAVFEIAPPITSNGHYLIPKSGAIGPEEPIWKYIAKDTVSFFSSYISGAHRLSNGNTFINMGAAGRFFEVTPEGEIVWDYWNPYRGKRTRPNGEPRRPGNNPFSLFRSNFIPIDHPAFEGKELTPLDPQPEKFVMPEKSE